MAVDLSRARIAVLGCGAVGQAFARGLLRLSPRRFSGLLVLWSRTPSSVDQTLASLRPRERGRVRVVASAEEAAGTARVALLCVSEEGFAPLARSLRHVRARPRATPAWLVASGSLPLEPLGRLRARGIAVGRLHPLAPFSRRGAGTLVGMPFGIQGDARAVLAARSLAAWFEGPVLPLLPGCEAQRAYHAGAALLGGGLVALLELTEQAMAPSLRVPPEELRGALHTFALAVAAEARERGPTRALTGPLARGSETTVRQHLAALGGVPNARAAYRVLGLTMLALARERGSLDAPTMRRMKAVLKRGGFE